MADVNGGKILLADVGGTYVRFVVLSDGVLGPIAHMAVAEHANFAEALEAFLARRADRLAIRRAIFGVAGVVEGERCPLTNNSWVVNAAELRTRFEFSGVRIVNDFEAIAWALPKLTPVDLLQLGGGAGKPQTPLLAIGPGTGLGVAAYVPRGAGGFVLHSEGGHTTLAGATPREDAIIELLREMFGHVSAERVLSGPGLQNLYRAIVSIDGLPVPERNAVEITQAAMGGVCAASRATLDLFCAWLGDVAGNLALTFCAQGGVFLCGGIVPHLRGQLPASDFRARFEAKGRMSDYVARIPAFLVLHEDPAFTGLQAIASQS